MVDLSKSFLHCLHCGNRTMEPRFVCPVCDWPRAHSFETAPPTEGCYDPNSVSAAPALQGGSAPPVTADVTVTGAVVIPGQVPASLAAIKDLGVLGAGLPERGSAIISLIQLAPEDEPLPEVEQ